MDPINVFDLEAIAREKLSREAYDYYAGGAQDEVTLRENRAAYDRLSLAYRVLVDVSRRDLATTVLGQPVSMPVLVAPTAFHRLADPRGGARHGPGRRSGGDGDDPLHPLEHPRRGGGGRRLRAGLVPALRLPRPRRPPRGWCGGPRPPAAGRSCSPSTLPSSAGGSGTSATASACRRASPWPTCCRRATASVPPAAADSGLAAYVAYLLDPALSWKDVAWLQSITELPVLVKGIVRPDDALRAAEAGAAGVVVSNHGGRQLDTAPATIDVLPEIADALAARGHQIEVLMDGGVRRGTDVLKALALGARAVLVGRPVLWGLAADGEAGARPVLRLLRDELDLAMALAGAPTLADITRDLVRRGPAGR